MKSSKTLILALLLICVTSCRHIPVSSDTAHDFDDGISTLAKTLADQLDKATIGNMLSKTVGDVLNKVKIGDLGNRIQLKRITIDPFIDAESGYPLKANAAIKKLMAEELQGRYQVTGEMNPDNLTSSEYVLSGYVTYQKSMKDAERYCVLATIIEKASGDVLASASVYVHRVDTAPLSIYMDSPVFLKGRNYRDLLSLVKKPPGSSTTRRYIKRLQAKSVLVRGDMFYEQQDYKRSLADYNELASQLDEPELEVCNGQFTNLVKQGLLEEAEETYGNLLRAGISQTDQISNKIFFAPNSVVPLESNIGLYKMYLRQIAQLVASAPGCRVQIIGHCSRSGSESFNDKLSLQRAEWVHDQMAAVEPIISGRSETIGRGFRENLVGSGRDDITDAIDRRVDFRFIQCGAAVDDEPGGQGKDQDKREPNADAAEAVAPNALQVEDIEYYLRNKVSCKLIASRIAERGVRFQLNDQIRKRLRKSKADSRIFKAIEEAQAGKQREEP